jgi:mRNA interferase RelE/StbE
MDVAFGPRDVGIELRRSRENPLVLTEDAACEVRRGPYRLLYRIDDAQLIVWILRVDHRADVYRRQS